MHFLKIKSGLFIIRPFFPTALCRGARRGIGKKEIEE
jgi:hypothetical protein